LVNKMPIGVIAEGVEELFRNSAKRKSH
jgi:hypothetical protein